MIRLGALLQILLLLSVGACISPNVVPENCPYASIAEEAILEKYPDFSHVSAASISMQRTGNFVEGYYALPRVMPGGTAHAEIRIRDCKVVDVWLTQ